MAVDEHRRVVLFEQLMTVLGQEATSTLFEILPASGTTVATGHDVDRLGGDLRGEMAGLRVEMGDLRSELRGQRSDLLAAFRAELNEALTRNTRTMLVGLVGTLVSTIGLAAVLARFVV